MRHAPAAGHVTTERLVPGATLIGLDHAPAGEIVVDVAAREVAVALGALEPPEFPPHAAPASATTVVTAQAALTNCGRRVTRSGPGARSPRGRDGATKCRAR